MFIQHIQGNTISHSNECIFFFSNPAQFFTQESLLFYFELAGQIQLKHRWLSVPLFPICHPCSGHSNGRVGQVTYHCTSPPQESLVKNRSLEMCHKCLGRGRNRGGRAGKQEREDTERKREDGTRWLLLCRWLWCCLLLLESPREANPWCQADLYSKYQLLSHKVRL